MIKKEKCKFQRILHKRRIRVLPGEFGENHVKMEECDSKNLMMPLLISILGYFK